MKSNVMQFYEDDEGMAVDLVLQTFGQNLVQCISLEADSVSDKMKSGIIFLIENQDNFFY